MIMPLIIEIAQNSDNQEFINELNSFITLIRYNEEYTVLNEAMQKTIVK